MSVLSQISAGMVRASDDGRRVFQHGLWPARRRSVFVTDDEERRLRRTYEWGVALTIVAIAISGPLLPLWFRLLVIVPASTVALEARLRWMTASLPAAPEPALPLTFSNVILAAAPGQKLLWAQLVFFALFAALCSSSLVSYEDVGWRKYVGTVIGIAMAVQASYQLLLLRQRRTAKENGRR
jgi:hypothetical protein